MSINYKFTDHGTIQVWCGDDWIEIRLPGGGAAGPRGRSPDVSDPDGGAGPAAMPDQDESEPEPEPLGAPGSMSFIGMVGARGRQPRLLLWSAPPARRPRSLFEPFHLSSAGWDDASQLSSTPNGAVQIMTIDIESLARRSPLSAVQLNQLVRAWELDMGATGLGMQERDE